MPNKKGTMNRRIGALVTAGIVATGVVTNQPNEPAKMPARVNEVVEQRTATSYTVQRQDGTMQTIVHTRPIHWRDSEGNWRRPDLRVKGRPWLTGLYSKYEAEVTAGPYEAQFDNNDLGDYRFEVGDTWIEYDLQTDVAVDYETEDMGVKEFITLQSGDPDTLVWQLTGSSTPIWDGAVLTVPGSDIRTQPLVAWDAADEPVSLEASYFAGRLTVAVDTTGVAWPVVVDPSTTVTPYNDDQYDWYNYNKATYSDARNATAADYYGDPGNTVGQYYDGALYDVYRSWVRFGYQPSNSLPEDAVIDSIVIACYQASNSSVSFNVWFVEHTGSGGYPGDNWNNFEGWQSSGAYTSTKLNKTLTISTGASGDSLFAVLNDNGINQFMSESNWLQYIILSENDINNVAPTGGENDNLDVKYMRVVYTQPYQNPPTGFVLHGPTTTSLTASWTNNHTSGIDSLFIVDGDSAWVETVSGKLDTTLTLSGLTPGKSYTFAAAVDSAGDKGYSNLDTLDTLPNTPTSLDISEVDSLHVSLSFDGNGNDAGCGYALRDSIRQAWFDAAGDTTQTKTLRTEAQWEATQLSVEKDERYLIGLVAENDDGVQSDYVWDTVVTNNKKIFAINAVAENHYNSSSPNYADARGETSPDSIDVSGSDQIGQANGETVYRAYASFAIPTADSIISASIIASGIGDLSATDFNLRAYESTWSQGNAATDKFWRFDGYKAGITAYDGTNLLDAWSTATDYAGGGDADTLTVNSSGITLMEASYGDTLGLAILSSRDVTGTEPTGNEYIGLNTIKLLLTYYDYDHVPSGITVTEIDADSALVEWTDNSTTEDGFIVADLADSTAIADTTAANATSARIGGLVPNTKYRLIVGVYGGKVDGQYSSAADSTYTDAVAPGAPGLVFTSSDTMKVVPDTTDTGNPSYTEYAVQDSITGWYIDYTADPDTLDTSSSEVWGTRADWGDTIRVDITDYIGRLFGMRWKARSGE